MLAKNKKNLVSTRKKTDGARERRKRLPPPSAPVPPPVDRPFLAMPWFTASLALLVWLVLVASLLHLHPAVFHEYVPGQTAPATIHAEVEFEYVDYEATEKGREAVRRREPLVFRVNEEINREQLALVDAIHRFYQLSDNNIDNEQAEDLPPAAPSELESILEKLHQQHQLSEVEAFLEDEQKRTRLLEILQSALHQGVRPENIDDLFLDQPGPRQELRILDPLHDDRSALQPIEQVPTPQQAASNVQEAFREQFPDLSGGERQISLGIAEAVIMPNLSFHSRRTEEYRQQAARQVDSIMRVIAAGEILVQRGEQMTETDLERIYSYQRQIKARRRQAFGWTDAVPMAVLALILILGFGQGLLLFNRRFLHQRGHLLMIVLLIVIQVGATHLTIHLLQVREMSLFYLLGGLPAALAGVFAAQLVGLRIAVWTTVFTSLVAALQAGNSLQVFIVAVIAGVVGALLVYRARRRIHMFRAGVWLGLTFFFATSLFFLPRGIPAEAFGYLAIVALVNGLGTTILASTLMPIFEYAFGIVTDISLLEMSDLSHPLLRRLQI